jgi:hypothetical protein
MMPYFVGEDVWIARNQWDAMIAARSTEWWERYRHVCPLDWDEWTLAEASEWEGN